MEYSAFIENKEHIGKNGGFEPIFMPQCLFDFQKIITTWAIQKGRSAILADCGLGKTLMELVWAKNIYEHTGKPILILAPLAVSYQFEDEAEKFGIGCAVSRNGKIKHEINVTNYQRLHYFNRDDFSGVVCDESGCIKHFKGVLQRQVTEFMKKTPYRLLATATAAPNDYIELGTSSEALGELGYMDMLNMFFRNDQNTSDISRKLAFHGGSAPKWRFKKHAEQHFWKWVSSWARAIRKPSDIGCDDNDFILPKLIEEQHVIKNTRPLNGKMFVEEAVGNKEERQELRATLEERCEKAANLANMNGRSVVWCQLNDEGDLLEKLINGAVQVKGSQPDDEKEEKLLAFSRGKVDRLVTKAKIAQFGMNWQNCNHSVSFPSHSWESYYQTIRRFWRFGQKNNVKSDIVTTPALQRVISNLKRKAIQCDTMFSELISHMNDSITIDPYSKFDRKMEAPKWM